MKLKLLCAASLLVVTCFAADCPVTVTSIKRAGSLRRDGRAFEVRFKNTSAKEIQALKAAIIMFDATNDPYTLDPQWGMSTSKVKPGKEETLHFELDDLISSQFYQGRHWKSAQLYIDKIAFTDGTSWVDDPQGKPFACGIKWVHK